MICYLWFSDLRTTAENTVGGECVVVQGDEYVIGDIPPADRDSGYRIFHVEVVGVKCHRA